MSDNNKVTEWSIVVHWEDGKKSWLSSYLFDLSTNKDIFRVINDIWTVDESPLKHLKEAYVKDKKLERRLGS